MPDQLARDLRHGLRSLRRHRGITTAALLTIALAVGGASAVFATVYGVLLRPLPYPDPDALVLLAEHHPGADAPMARDLLSRPTYHTWTSASATLATVGSVSADEATLVTGEGSVRVRQWRVTPSMFALLGASPLRGRLFGEGDARASAAPVAVLSHRMWQERFGGRDTDTSLGTSSSTSTSASASASADTVIGSTIVLNGVAHDIIGVLPKGFALPLARAPRDSADPRDRRGDVAGVYTPFAVPPADPQARVVQVQTVIARLAPGATPAQAAAEGTARARAVTRPFADLLFGKGAPVEVRVETLRAQATRAVRPALTLVTIAVTLLCAIACANVASLLSSRARERRHESMVRAALGASRAQLVRPLLIEALLLALFGGAGGAALGGALLWLLPWLAPSDFARIESIRADAPFFAVVLASALLVGLIAGLVPALRGAVVRTGLSLDAVSGRTTPRMRQGSRLLLIVESALAVILLVGAALLTRSFLTLIDVDPGYRPAGVVTAAIHVDRQGLTADRVARLSLSLEERLRQTPGITAAGIGGMTPFGALFGAGFALPGMTTADGQPLVARALHAVVTPGYKDALGMELRAGRFLTAADSRLGGPIAIVVNESFVRQYLDDGRPALPRRFVGMFPRMLNRADAIVDIVGVVRDMLPGARDAAPQPQIFVPFGVGFDNRHVELALRIDEGVSGATRADVAPRVRALLAELEPGATLDRLSRLEEQLDASAAQPRFLTFVLVAFAAVAALLAATGLYGVLSDSVQRRRREIGLRGALGATRTRLLWMILRDGLIWMIAGMTLGLLAVSAAARALGTLLFGITAHDGVAFVAAPLILLIVGTLACALPARRAARIDPAEALRLD